MDNQDFNNLLNIQRNMANTIMQETNQDNKIDIMTIINELNLGSGKKIAIEEIIIEAQSQGIDENTTLNLIDELIKDKILQKIEEGFVSQK